MMYIPIQKILLNAMVLVKYCGIRLLMKPLLCFQRIVRIIQNYKLVKESPMILIISRGSMSV